MKAVTLVLIAIFLVLFGLFAVSNFQLELGKTIMGLVAIAGGTSLAILVVKKGI